MLVNLNFFGDKHGKNGRDVHFSSISRYIRNESMRRRIMNTQHIVEAIDYGTKITNNHRISIGNIEIKILNLKHKFYVSNSIF